MSLLGKTINGVDVPDDLRRRTERAVLLLGPIIDELNSLLGADATLNALLNLYVEFGLRAVGADQMNRVAAKIPEMVSEFTLILAEPRGRG